MMQLKKLVVSQRDLKVTLSKATNAIKGLRLEWSDKSPLCLALKTKENLLNPKTTHKNPVYNLMANEIWKKSYQFVSQTPFFWRIILDVHYTGAPKGDKLDTYTIEAAQRHVLADINKTCRKCMIDSMRGNKALPEGHKNKGVFSHVTFKIEVAKI